MFFLPGIEEVLVGVASVVDAVELFLLLIGGGMKADDVKRLKELEAENQKLERIVADQALAPALLLQVEGQK